MPCRAVVLICAALIACTGALAQHYPSRPIRIVVPFPPGAFNDTLGRIIAQKFTDSGFASAVVDNRPGAGTTLGADIVAKSAPDGYTLLIIALPFAVNQTLYTALPYDTLRDFAPVVYAGLSANLLTVHPSLPVKTVRELIALARARPGQLNYASAGSGTSPHMAMEMFQTMTGTTLVHVPYKGGAPALNDLIGGHVMMYCENLPHLLPHVQAGRLRGIAVTTAQRIKQAPEIPTMAETLPEFVVPAWFGVVAPAGVPQDIIGRLNAEINKVLALPDVRARFEAGAVEPVGGPPELFGEHLKAEVARWAKVVKATGARVD